MKTKISVGRNYESISTLMVLHWSVLPAQKIRLNRVLSSSAHWRSTLMPYPYPLCHRSPPLPTASSKILMLVMCETSLSHTPTQHISHTFSVSLTDKNTHPGQTHTHTIFSHTTTHTSPHIISNSRDLSLSHSLPNTQILFSSFSQPELIMRVVQLGSFQFKSFNHKFF